MEILKSVLSIAIAIVIGWHIKVFFSSDTKISGIFQEKPELGYSWKQRKFDIGGLGVSWVVDEKAGFPVIMAVESGSPAERTGVQVNDFIISIDGQSIEGWTIVQAQNVMLGQAGTDCDIIIQRDEKEIPLTFTRQQLLFSEEQLRLINANNPTAHFFWDNNDVVWCQGFVHPEFKVITKKEPNRWASLPGYKFVTHNDGDFNTFWQSGLRHPDFKAKSAEEEGTWNALPGYKFVGDGNLDTVWDPGQLYPGFNAWSTYDEGLWRPVVGYKFIFKDGLWTDVVWNPGRKYDELKVQSGEKKDTYIPYPGYKFVNPGVDLEVAWTSGLPHPNPQYANYVAGVSEGSWELSTQPEEPTASDYGLGWFVKGLASVGVRKLAGDNKIGQAIADELLHESSKDGVRAVVKALEK